MTGQNLNWLFVCVGQRWFAREEPPLCYIAALKQGEVCLFSSNNCNRVIHLLYRVTFRGYTLPNELIEYLMVSAS